MYGGGHGSFISEGYDCSGSVSYALHGGGLLSAPEDSSGLESYGEAGPGRYITIYANAEHAWMTIDGRRYDTVALAEDGTRWGGPSRRGPERQVYRGSAISATGLVAARGSARCTRVDLLSRRAASP